MRNSGSREQLVAIVQAQIRSDDRSARALIWLSVKTIFRSHPHQRVREATVFLRDSFDTVGSILTEPVGDAFEFAPHHAATVEPDEFRQFRSSACSAEPSKGRKSSDLSIQYGSAFPDLDPGVGDECMILARNTEAEPA